MIVLVPNELRDRINARLALALQDWPEATESERDTLFAQLLDYHNRYGVLPDFSIVKAMGV